MDRVFLSTELSNPLRQLAIELLLALSNQYPLHGKIAVAIQGEEHSFTYSGAHQAAGILTSCEDVSMLSIKDTCFSLLLDTNDTGVELSFVPVSQSDHDVYAQISQLSIRILSHLEAMEA